MAAVFRWSRHREMPRPIRATPVGTDEPEDPGLADLAQVYAGVMAGSLVLGS